MLQIKAASAVLPPGLPAASAAALQRGLGCWQQFAMQPVLPAAAEGLFPRETISTACTPQSCSSCPSFSSYSPQSSDRSLLPVSSLLLELLLRG